MTFIDHMIDPGDKDILYREAGQLKTGNTRTIEVKVPVVVLENPKYGHNVGAALRAASVFGISQVWFSGTRVGLDSRMVNRKFRLPREERMKVWKDTSVIQFEYPLRILNDGKKHKGTPVCVEVGDGYEQLPYFEHPEDAIYVFGPEDGGVSKALRVACHRFVTIPSKSCLNLAAAVNVVLYDRMMKEMVISALGASVDEQLRGGSILSDLNARGKMRRRR